MKKIYKSKLSSLSFAIRVDGKYTPIEFKYDIIHANGRVGCSYTTENEHAIAILDNHKYLKQGLYWGEEIRQPKQHVAPKEIKRIVKKV